MNCCLILTKETLQRSKKMKERAKNGIVWENAGGTIEVWIEEEFGQERVHFHHQNSNMSQGIYLEEAKAIENAMAYFKNVNLI